MINWPDLHFPPINLWVLASIRQESSIKYPVIPRKKVRRNTSDFIRLVTKDR